MLYEVITSYIAASTDGKFRVLVKDNGEYLGDVVLSNGSGISAVEVIPEPATLGLVGAFGAMVVITSYSIHYTKLYENQR